VHVHHIVAAVQTAEVVSVTFVHPELEKLEINAKCAKLKTAKGVKIHQLGVQRVRRDSI
jgi:hypothetical protein